VDPAQRFDQLALIVVVHCTRRDFGCGISCGDLPVGAYVSNRIAERGGIGGGILTFLLRIVISCF
jgi:hypothetical protein